MIEPIAREYAVFIESPDTRGNVSVWHYQVVAACLEDAITLGKAHHVRDWGDEDELDVQYVLKGKPDFCDLTALAKAEGEI
jgi:hypothetical protein